MQIVPVNKQIIVKVPKPTEGEKKIGSLIIPESVATEKPYQAIVYKSDHEDYKTGDVVVYRKYSGFEFQLDDVDYLCIEAGDVLVKLVDE